MDKIAVFDIEAMGWDKYLIGGLYDGKNYYIYKDIGGLVNKMLEYKYIYGFYNSKYDNNFILSYLIKNKIKFNFILNNGKMYNLKIKNTIIRDLFFYSYTSLNKAVENYTGLKNLKTSINYKTLNKDMSKTIKYLKNDLYITYKLLKVIKNRFDIKKNITISSIALNYFKDNIKHSIDYNKQYQDIENKIDVWGGRVELFYKNGKNIEVFDINSLYPSIFINNDIPYNIEYEIDTILINHINLKDDIYLMLVDYKDIDKIPYIPSRLKDNTIVYCKGLKSKVWIYSNCIDINNIKQVYKIYKMQVIPKHKFKFLLKWYELKQNNYAYKILLNSFYGKFLQKPLRDIYKIEYDIEKVLYWQNKGYDIIKHNGNAFILNKKSFNKFIFHNRFIGKFITDKSRCIITRDIIKLLNNNIKVYYTDTDSIHTEHNNKVYKILNIDNKKIGHYKTEGVFNKANYYNPKHYELIGTETVNKHKGGKDYIKTSIKDTLKTGKFIHKKIVKEDKADYTDKKKLNNNKYEYYNIDKFLNKILTKHK